VTLHGSDRLLRNTSARFCDIMASIISHHVCREKSSSFPYRPVGRNLFYTAPPNTTPIMVVLKTTEFVVLDGVKRSVHTWKNEKQEPAEEDDDNKPVVLVVIYHGFLAHGLYPTVRYAAELLSSSQETTTEYTVVVVAADMRGHGQSDGIPGYLASADQCIADGRAVARYAVETHGGGGNNNNHHRVDVVLLGSSMGGTIALHVAQQLTHDPFFQQVSLKGVILLAPMLKLKVSVIEEALLYSLTCFLPNEWPVIPLSSLDAAKQYRDVDKRRECEEDDRVVQVVGAGNGKKLRLGSAYTLTQLVKTVPPPMTTVVPVLLMVADEDVVVDSQGSLDYYQQAVKLMQQRRQPPQRRVVEQRMTMVAMSR
jgi:alpha-beta hydrolase superfamily lysophospholipase